MSLLLNCYISFFQALPNQQTVDYPSFKLVIVGDGGTGIYNFAYTLIRIFVHLLISIIIFFFPIDFVLWIRKSLMTILLRELLNFDDLYEKNVEFYVHVFIFWSIHKILM